ncbi:iron-containing redox enzyme family protein [Cellulomonas sp. ATA003]|uniref:iron-containing redox enzyme family protein n=1 Tax=Cellulomonas sp. ATA003 TaxID=3073064 RepID=UPI0028731FFD|nr:iron-containing redox enzyme family protein [Cellulomonas sp. ATA003]WNB86894.1 iron-containing redox enzyme family protein [Cellulomonas sp. ATA003]
MRPPAARGPLSESLLDALRGAPGPVPAVQAAADGLRAGDLDVVADDDLQLTLFVLYELHYRGVEGVDEAWEWQPDLLRVRADLEAELEAALRDLVPVPSTDARSAGEVAQALFDLTAADSGPGLSGYVAKRATDEQLREFVVQRSIYHLKEADPHSWALPRLSGRPKSALIEIQADEYGGGRPGHIHAELFATTMRALGLDDAYGAYLDAVPAPTLASVNVMSLFGLHRRLRGAITGHLAAFEMTSSIPCRRYASGFRRLGYGDDVTRYFDEHVEADAVHEQIAGRDLAGALAQDDPAVRDDVLWGAATYLAVDGLAGAQMLAAWQEGRSSLRRSSALAAAPVG